MKNVSLLCALFYVSSMIADPIPEGVDFRKEADISIEFHWKRPENMTDEQKVAWASAEKKVLEQIERFNESDKTGDKAGCSTKDLANLVLEFAELFKTRESVVHSISVNPKG